MTGAVLSRLSQVSRVSEELALRSMRPYGVLLGVSPCTSLQTSVRCEESSGSRVCLKRRSRSKQTNTLYLDPEQCREIVLCCVQVKGDHWRTGSQGVFQMRPVRKSWQSASETLGSFCRSKQIQGTNE